GVCGGKSKERGEGKEGTRRAESHSSRHACHVGSARATVIRWKATATTNQKSKIRGNQEHVPTVWPAIRAKQAGSDHRRGARRMTMAKPMIQSSPPARNTHGCSRSATQPTRLSSINSL